MRVECTCSVSHTRSSHSFFVLPRNKGAPGDREGSQLPPRGPLSPGCSSAHYSVNPKPSGFLHTPLTLHTSVRCSMISGDRAVFFCNSQCLGPLFKIIKKEGSTYSCSKITVSTCALQKSEAVEVSHASLSFSQAPPRARDQSSQGPVFTCPLSPSVQIPQHSGPTASPQLPCSRKVTHWPVGTPARQCPFPLFSSHRAGHGRASDTLHCAYTPQPPLPTGPRVPPNPASLLPLTASSRVPATTCVVLETAASPDPFAGPG